MLEQIRIARQKGFIINQMEIYCNFSNKKICFYLKFRIPKLHRQLFRILSQNGEYVERFCNNGHNPFHFACRKQISEHGLEEILLESIVGNQVLQKLHRPIF